MTLAETIYRRKATKKFDMTQLDANTLNGIKAFAGTLTSLYDGISVRYEFLTDKEVKSFISTKAPHYIAISSEVKDGYLQNVGFMFQQMDLKLQSMGLGSHWLGTAKPIVKPDVDSEFVIVLAFGKSAEPLYRDMSGFKRKALSEISDNEDRRLEPARLAPSGLNAQPWYFISDGKDIHAYCVKRGSIMAKMYDKMDKIGIGIALAHLYSANTDTFDYFEQAAPKPVKGYYYIGSIKI